MSKNSLKEFANERREQWHS